MWVLVLRIFSHSRFVNCFSFELNGFRNKNNLCAHCVLCFIYFGSPEPFSTDKIFFGGSALVVKAVFRGYILQEPLLPKIFLK